MQDLIVHRGHNGVGVMVVPMGITYPEFSVAIEKLLLLPGLPAKFQIGGEVCSWCDLQNSSARYLVWQSMR